MPKGFRTPLKERFNEEAEKHPRWSSYAIFAEVIRKHKYPAREVKREFSRLVDKSDYSRHDKKDILQYLLSRPWEGA